MLSMEIDFVVPGHGPVAGMEMVEAYDRFFGELEAEVKAFNAEGVSIEDMASKSKTMHFFPIEEIPREEVAGSWIGDQYRAAAMAILFQE
jgi:hypothetical protein